jgi:hypothetical protein
MITIAVIIKHPYRGNDYRVDIYEVEEETPLDDLRKHVMDKMLGPFEIVAMTTRISNQTLLTT